MNKRRLSKYQMKIMLNEQEPKKSQTHPKICANTMKIEFVKDQNHSLEIGNWKSCIIDFTSVLHANKCFY